MGDTVNDQPKPRDGAKWDNARCIELERLQELLTTVASINNGSNVLGNLARCIEIAELLHRFDLGSGRASFNQFLRDLAIDDRFGAAQKG
jgi:hypothetical protein